MGGMVEGKPCDDIRLEAYCNGVSRHARYMGLLQPLELTVYQTEQSHGTVV